MAAARTIDGPPMSISSTSSSSESPGLRAASANGYRLTTTRSNGAMPAARSASRWSARRRSARSPPWTRGCNVFTRPSSISGKPVTAATSVTGRPAWRRARAVPPVRHQLPAARHEAAAQLGQPGLVGHGQQRPARDRASRHRRRRGRAAPAGRPRPRSARRPAATLPPRQQPVLDGVDPGEQRLPRCRRAGPVTASWATIGPPSSVASTRCTVTPVTATPAARASRAPWSPGNDGSSDGWTLRIRPSNLASTAGPTRRRYPASTTTSGSTAASVSASVASSPPGSRIVSMPCSAAQSRPGHGRSANTSTTSPPRTPRSAAATSARRFDPVPDTPTAIRPLTA